ETPPYMAAVHAIVIFVHSSETVAVISTLAHLLAKEDVASMLLNSPAAVKLNVKPMETAAMGFKRLVSLAPQTVVKSGSAAAARVTVTQMGTAAPISLLTVVAADMKDSVDISCQAAVAANLAA